MVLGFGPQEFSHVPNSQTQIAFSKMPNSCHKLQCPIFHIPNQLSSKIGKLPLPLCYAQHPSKVLKSHYVGA